MKGHQLVVAIINAGFSTEVMDVAKENGANGGTVIHARGSGYKPSENKYGIVITPDKEMVLIVVKNEDCDKIIEAISKQAGIGTKVQGIVFSLPVSHVSGLRF
jgi:nitrogen regulatory protein PII